MYPRSRGTELSEPNKTPRHLLVFGLLIDADDGAAIGAAIGVALGAGIGVALGAGLSQARKP